MENTNQQILQSELNPQNELQKDPFHDIAMMTLFFGTIIALFLFGGIIEQEWLENNARKNIAHAINSPDLEKELKSLDNNLIIKQSIDTTNYSLQIPKNKIYSFIKGRFYFFDIIKEKNSRTLIINNQLIRDADGVIMEFKDIMGNNITEIKTIPDLKTGMVSVSFKVGN